MCNLERKKIAKNVREFDMLIDDQSHHIYNCPVD